MMQTPEDGCRIPKEEQQFVNDLEFRLEFKENHQFFIDTAVLSLTFTSLRLQILKFAANCTKRCDRQWA